MARKKLLFVIENSSYGGGEKTFSLLLQGLPRDRYELFCASRAEGRFYEEVRDHCVFIPFDLSRRFLPGGIGRLAGIVRGCGAEVVHSQGARADFYSAFAAARAGVQAVATVAMPVDGFETGFIRKRLYLFLCSLAERRTAAFITVSGFLRDFLSGKHGIPADNITVIANPAVTGPVDAAAGRVPGRLRLAAMGRLEVQKGFDVLLEALAILNERSPSLGAALDCVIAGEGSQRDALALLSARLGLSGKVSMPGFRPDAAVFSGTDIFVLPSRAEGQPLVLLEAMASGLPVISADLPGVREVCSDGIDARLFVAGDAGALAAAIAELGSDPALRSRLGRAASAAAGKYTLEAFLRAHDEFYAGLAGGAR